jgi:hypothetical protein
MEKQISNQEIDGFKVTMAIRELESGEVWHECYDIEEEGVEEILTRYGIFFKFNEAELVILKEQLIAMAERAEIKEAERWAKNESDPLIMSIPDRPMPKPATLELQRMAYLAEIGKKQKEESADEVEPDPTIDNLIKELRLEVI